MMFKLTMTTDANNPTIGDLHLENGQLVFLETESVEHIAQRIYQRFNFFKGEWYLNLLEGFPYYEKILKKNPDLDQISGMFRRALKDVPGVADITYFSINLDKTTRELSIDFSAKSDTGAVIPVSGPFIVKV